MTVPSFSLQHGRKHKCPLKGEWVSNVWYTHTMEYYSALKGKEILTHHNMDELRRHYNNWNKLVTKRQASHDSTYIQSSSVAQSCPTLWPRESQHARPPCPSQTPGVYSSSCPSSQWCHPAISSSVIPFSCPQSLPASGSFPMSQLFTWGGQSIGVSASASVLPTNNQDLH